MNKKQKYIYVIISKTMTIPGRVIRKFTGGQYSHASISLDKNLNEIYSFARLNYYSPLIAGFIRESVSSLSLGKEEGVDVKLYKIPVTNYQFRSIKRTIERFKENSDKYLYNILALVLFPVTEFNVRDTYICTEFVAKTLANAKIKPDKLMKNRITPKEIIDALKEYEIYSGSLNEYVKKLSHEDYDGDFFKRENKFYIIAKSIKRIGILIYRKII
jgi:hypothetical protein